MLYRITLPIVGALLLAACQEETAEAPVETAPPEVTVGEVGEPATAPPLEAPGEPVGPTTDETGSVGTAATSDLSGTYVGGPVTLQLQPDGSFMFEAREGEGNVSGTYAVEGEEIAFMNPSGETAGATFPIRCRLLPTGGGFELQDSGGACGPFSGVVFERRE